MPGYLVIPEEACDLSGNMSGKVKLNPMRLGLTDLIRQFEQDPFPFTRSSSAIALIGLDEFLVQMDQLESVNDNAESPFLLTMHQRLRKVSNEVGNIGTIHIPIRHELWLAAGNRLFIRYAGKRIPLWRLFGSHPTIETYGKFPAYHFGVNLS
jgi:hypothetical protein